MITVEELLDIEENVADECARFDGTYDEQTDKYLKEILKINISTLKRFANELGMQTELEVSGLLIGLVIGQKLGIRQIGQELGIEGGF